MNNQGLTAAQKLLQIKSGAKKTEMNKYLNAATNNTATFQALPVPKPKHGQSGVKAENKVEIQSFQATAQKGSAEARSIEDMFDDGGGSYGMTMPQNNFQMQQNPNNGTLDVEALTPSFNPEVAVQRARQRQQSNQYLKFAQNNPDVQSAMQMINATENPEVYAQQIQMQQQKQTATMPLNEINPTLVEMMKVISKAMAEETISKVLSEYTQQQKGKLTFEYYNKEKTIIKTGDGRYYKLTSLEIVEENGKKKFRMVN